MSSKGITIDMGFRRLRTLTASMVGPAAET